MTDTMTPEQRHRCMSHIRSKDTKPELKVRKWLWSHGYRYRLNVKSVPGKPDIVMRPYRTAIFVNGCFGHGHGVTESPVKGCELRVYSESSEPRSGKNLHDLQDLVRRGRQGELERDLQNSKCCKIPKANREFWVKKIRRNQERDQENYRVLQENGWKVIVIWECQLTAKRIEHTMREVELLLNDNMLSLYKHHKPVPYTTEEGSSLPMAAEDNRWGRQCPK